MDRERHHRLIELFEELACVPAEQQAARLEALRLEDEELFEELGRMLAADP